MTSKLTITRERMQEIAEDGFLKHGESKELARMALAAMDSEPVAIIDQANLDYLRSGADADVWPPEREEMGDVLLYRHAQPAPVAQKEPISFDEWSRKCALQITLCYPDFREKAQYIWDSARETQQPAPVVPEDVLDALQKVARIRLDLNGFDGDRRGIADCLCDAEEALIEVVNRRAAMLQGAENAESRCGIQTAPALDSFKKNSESRCGNSPAIPDGYRLQPISEYEAMCATVNSDEWPQRWIPVSERMPERGDYLVTDGRDFDVQSFDGEQFIPGFVWEDAITHWMPLPAAPQEVK
ncbi:DUF551 domain-containing protein [Klebsiella pneumoniae]